MADTCPGGDLENECQTRTCIDGVCGIALADEGTELVDQTAGDCKTIVCDGAGAPVAIDNDADILDDGKSCTDDACSAGSPTNLPKVAGAVCAEGLGTLCDGAGECVECLGPDQCGDKVCQQNHCIPHTCMDGVLNGAEVAIDCGGADCLACADDSPCLVAGDCLSGVCTDSVCQAPNCGDGVENGNESDVDCGSACPDACAPGAGCAIDEDCAGGLCSGSLCLPTCTDGAQNQSETGIDCGGAECNPCADGGGCQQASDCASQVCDPSGECSAPRCGDGVVNAGDEACDDGNASDTDACLSTCIAATCGDGHVHAGVEACDDGNALDTDACLPTCVAAACGDGIVQAGVEACDDGNGIANDGCTNACALPTCGDGIVQAVEQCDDGNADATDGCTTACLNAVCGDGFLRAGVETCDDGDGLDNDGCSAVCAAEQGYSCVGLPSVCTSAKETNCNDGGDNDGDGLIDCADSDCALGCDANVGACPAGQQLLVYTGADVPKNIVDFTTVSSVLSVPGLGTIERAVLQIDITHTWDSDLSVSLVSPAGVSGDMTSGNGSSGDNYTNTILNTACSTAVTAGTAPFAGCYRPEATMVAYNGGAAKGNWTLNVADGASGDVGTVNAFRLALCVSPTLCGNGVVDVGEACDDGNTSNTDACLNTCLAASCGDTFVQAGVETCDDGNHDSTDACLNTCVVATCGDGFVRAGVEACDDGNQDSTDACLNTCVVATCGDGFLRAGVETCDDGNQSNTDACLATCLPATCGDGFLRAGVEGCDDANQSDTDACLNTCVVATCGDGFLRAGVETCDDGNLDNTDACAACAVASCGDGFVHAGVEACDDGNASNTDACLATCVTPTCGDGFVRAGVEQCDDANQDDTDACRNSCVTATCGDGVVHAGVEQCDDANATSTDACIACVLAACGDGFVEAGVEGCDDGNQVDTDNCLPTCVPASCGDHALHAGVEGCDDGNTDGGDGCSAVCALEGCGDGVTTGAEQCDDGNLSNDDGCLNTCVLAACGDGFVNAGVEQCDDGNPSNTDGCLTTCAFATCGDSFVYAGIEACDDGNLFEDDACLSSCLVATCGDGFVRAGVEQCDDANPDNNDACTSACVNARCGDGYVRAGVEQCDDSDGLDNDGCSALCAPEVGYSCAAGSPSVCTSAVEMNCNDAFDNDADGLADCADSDCALGCDVNFGACAAGDSLIVYTSADVPKAIPDSVSTPSTITVNGVGLVQKTAIQLNITHTFDGDLDISLVSPSGVSGDMTSDNGSSGDNYTNTILNSSCAALVTAGTAPFSGCYAPETSMTTYNGRPSKGTWTLVTADDASGDTGTLNSWRLALCASPTLCGNGVVDAAEACDDGNSTVGDGCSATCTLEVGFNCAPGNPTVCTAICGDGLIVGTECEDGNAVNGDGCSTACAVEAGFACFGTPSLCRSKCGDSLVVTGEACDDGNTTVGDGCNSSCQLEVALTEIESNDSFALADASAIQITGPSTTISGAIPVIGDKDFFRVTVAADSVVRFETFDGTGSGCLSITTAIRLFNSAQTQLYLDSTSGISSCSGLSTFLTAGTYYIQMEESGNNGTVAAYRLETTIQAAYSETEPNDTLVQANPFLGSDAYMLGGHQVIADADYYRIVIPTTRSIRAETIEGSTAETCEANGISSRIALFNSAGTQLTTNDTSGRGNCSLLDGTGASPQTSAAKNLPPGIYYLEVLAGSAGTGAAGQFDYRLLLTIR